MRIVFVGAVDFSKHCLEKVVKNSGNVVAVLTLSRENAGFHSDYADLGEVAGKHGIPVHGIRNINDPGTVELVQQLSPDVIFVFGWSQLILKEIRDIPPLGCIGLHPTLLPRNRGRHPLIWALVEGLDESGLTFFYIDEGTDSGDILWQEPFPITLEDDAGTLYEKIKILASAAIREFLPQLERGTAPRIPQDHSKATYWRKRTEKDGEINWVMPTIGSYNLVRALTRPYVGAHTYLKGEKLLVWRAAIPKNSLPLETLEEQPGTVLEKTDSGFDVRTGDGYLKVLEYQLLREKAIEIGLQLGN